MKFGLTPCPPMTNAERQRLFRQRHPNYYKKYRARRKGVAYVPTPATPDLGLSTWAGFRFPDQRANEDAVASSPETAG